MTNAREIRESKRGWLVVFGAMIGLSVGLSPVPFYTMGMFATVLADQFGWSFALMMGALTVQSWVAVFTAPVAGMLVDRYGARPIAMISLVLFGLSYASLGFTTGSIWLFYAQWVLIAIGGAGTLYGTWTSVVAGWFNRNRGLALGIASTGTGLTGIIIKPLTAWLILQFGWQTAFFVIGALPILIGLPIVFLCFRAPRQSDLQPAAAQEEASETAEVEPLQEGYTVKEAIRTRQFWVMGAAFLFIAFSLTAPTPNLENILRSLDFDLATAGRIGAVFGLSVIFGRIAGGWLLDKLWAPACALVIFALPAIGCIALTQAGISEWGATAAVAALGVAAGFEFDALAYLVSRYFGQRNYATIYGYFFAVVLTGGGLGPVVYGYVFDRTQSYAAILPVGSALLMLGCVILLFMGPYPKNFGKSH
jgi:MFS family permease